MSDRNRDQHSTRLGATGGLTPTQWLFNKIWSELWDTNSAFYLPNLFKNGFNGYGQNIPPLDPTSIPDLTGLDLLQALPGSPCGEGEDDITNGDATLDLTGTTLSGLSTISANGDLQFPNGDYEVVIPVQFSNLEATGAWTVNQPCTIANPCAATTFARLLGAPQSDVDAWQQVKQDLETRGFGKGQEYIRCYNKWSPTISSVLNNSAAVKDAIQKYDGNQLWNQIVAAINTGSQLPSGGAAQTDMEQIIGAIMDAIPSGQQEDFYSDYNKVLPDLLQVVANGITYEQFIESLNASQDDSSCCQSPSARDSNNWIAYESGTFDDTLTGITATITAQLLVDSTGNLFVNVTDISVTVSDIVIRLKDNPLIDWLENYVANTTKVKNMVISGLSSNIDTSTICDTVAGYINGKLQNIVTGIFQ